MKNEVEIAGQGSFLAVKDKDDNYLAVSIHPIRVRNMTGNWDEVAVEGILDEVNPRLAITTCTCGKCRNEKQNRFSITHVPTGTAIAEKHLRFREAQLVVEAIRNFDWDFITPKPPQKLVRTVPKLIKAVLEGERRYRALDHGFVRLVDHMGDDLSVVRAARVSYDAAWRTGEDSNSDNRLHAYWPTFTALAAHIGGIK